MQKHLSRRELTRRVAQGRSAMRVLAAAVVQAGGAIRISRDTYEALPPGHRMEVEREALTGDLIVRAHVPGQVGEVLRDLREMTFDEIRAKYRDAGTGSAEEADATGTMDRHLDGQHDPREEVRPPRGGEAGSEPED